MSAKPPVTLAKIDREIDTVQTNLGDVIDKLDRILAILRRRRKKKATSKPL